MEFRNYLKEDIDRIGCTLSELSRASGLSNAVISRYRSGERVPRQNSEMLEMLCSGLDQLDTLTGGSPVPGDRLHRYRSLLSEEPSLLAVHFDQLLRTLQISMKDISYVLNYDASYLSRIRSGKRTPADPAAFAEHVARALNDTLRPADKALISAMLGISDPDQFNDCLAAWLIEKEPSDITHIERFLNQIENFDLDQFIRSIQFDSPAAGNALPPGETKYYYGMLEHRSSELDFFTTVLASGCPGIISMCTDFPMLDLADDISFVKQWVSLIADVLKAGNEIHIIHDVNRPFSEMAMGLESWIPLYMTGKIVPFYLNTPESPVYRHLIYSSDQCLLTAEGIGSTSEDSCAILSSDPTRIRYGQQRIRNLFARSSPLMKVFRPDQLETCREFWKHENEAPGNRYIKSSVPPIFTLSGDLLRQMLVNENIDQKHIFQAEAVRMLHLSDVNQILRNNSITLDMPLLSREEFDRYTPEFVISLPDAEIAVHYTWETYQKHLRLTKEFSLTNPSFVFTEEPDSAFRNLFIYVRDNKMAVVVKLKTEQITFTISHPKMIQALRHFTTPVFEKEQQ